MFGFSKAFAIVVFIAFIMALGMRDPIIGLKILGGYALAKVVWNLLTKERK